MSKLGDYLTTFNFIHQLRKINSHLLIELVEIKAQFADLRTHVYYSKQNLNDRNGHWIFSCPSKVGEILLNKAIWEICPGQTAAELSVFYLHSVIYFKNLEDKEHIYSLGMTKEGSGKDAQFIASRQIQVWWDKKVSEK